MIRLIGMSLLICVLGACMVSAQAANRMPYGAFLTRPVSDINDLASHIREDRVVAQRFADFYGVSNDALADYIEKNGKTVTLTKSGSYLEYFLDAQGKVRKHNKLLRPGVKILAVNNVYVMDMRCGNPMVRTLPQVVEEVKPIIQETPPAPVEAPPVEAIEIPQLLPEPELPPPPAPEPVVEVIPETPMEYPTAMVSPGIQEFALLLPGLFALGTLSGGGNEPVPEPTGFMVLGLGGAGFVLTCSRKLRKR